MAVRPPRSGSSLTVASTTAPSTQTDDPIAHAVRSFSRPANVAGYARIFAAANNPEEARLLLLYDRQDFVQGEWPEELREQVAEMTRRIEGGAERRARVIFGHHGLEEVRLAQFLVAEVPVAAVRQHLLRHEAPPLLVDHLIRTTYRAVVTDYRTQKRKSAAAGQAV
jgi:hypothetical protein